MIRNHIRRGRERQREKAKMMVEKWLQSSTKPTTQVHWKCFNGWRKRKYKWMRAQANAHTRDWNKLTTIENNQLNRRRIAERSWRWNITIFRTFYSGFYLSVDDVVCWWFCFILFSLTLSFRMNRTIEERCEEKMIQNSEGEREMEKSRKTWNLMVSFWFFICSVITHSSNKLCLVARCPCHSCFFSTGKD